MLQHDSAWRIILRRIRAVLCSAAAELGSRSSSEVDELVTLSLTVPEWRDRLHRCNVFGAPVCTGLL